jgi:hypothetical protein
MWIKSTPGGGGFPVFLGKNGIGVYNAAQPCQRFPSRFLPGTLNG